MGGGGGGGGGGEGGRAQYNFQKQKVILSDQIKGDGGQPKARGKTHKSAVAMIHLPLAGPWSPLRPAPTPSPDSHPFSPSIPNAPSLPSPLPFSLPSSSTPQHSFGHLPTEYI